ncbi:MAG TPA: hypothetical protein VJ870_12950 [Amycolatopsis sp.]|nr:hypothetical protein [Amycolatopsis sp.]
MKLRPGTSLVSTTDETTVIVVRWDDADLEVACGGAPMVDARGPEKDTKNAADPAQQDGTQLGKRYTTEDGGVELLCTKAGQGTLSVDGTPLGLKSAKPLPASD